MITDGITNANISCSKYLSIIDGVDNVVGSGDLAILWILNPRINDDVPIKKETMVKIFCVRLGIRLIGMLESN
jgi:hypothetical protein